ncbi:hypothetical protein D3C86_1746440 [compost metagenome]
MNDLVGKVMHIDHNIVNAKTLQIADIMLQQGLTVKRCQGFGVIVRKRFQAGTQTRR